MPAARSEWRFFRSAGESEEAEAEEDAEQADDGRGEQAGEIAAGDESQRGMGDAVDDGCDGEEPDEKEGGAVAALQAEGRENPHAEPREVEDDEEILRPWGETEEYREAGFEAGEELFREVKALSGEAEEENLEDAVAGDGVRGRRLAEEGEQKCGERGGGEASCAEEDALEVGAVHGTHDTELGGVFAGCRLWARIFVYFSEELKRLKLLADKHDPGNPGRGPGGAKWRHDR